MNEVLQRLLPGKELVLSSGLTVTVYPLGLRHMKKFVGKLSSILAVVAKTKFAPGTAAGDIAKAALANAGPTIALDLVDLVQDCVAIKEKDFTLDDLPHWEVATIVETWIIESFGEETKWRPWVQAIENLVKAFTKQKDFSLTSLMASSSSSPADTTSTRS